MRWHERKKQKSAVYIDVRMFVFWTHAIYVFINLLLYNMYLTLVWLELHVMFLSSVKNIGTKWKKKLGNLQKW